MRETGVYQNLGDVKYFIPHSLSPMNPQLMFSEEMRIAYGDAMYELGRLSNITPEQLPNVRDFINAYVFKEALLSSEIEGINTTLLDVFTRPISGTKLGKETQLVRSYKEALDFALSKIRDDELPASSRVILSVHEKLMLNPGEAAPGQYRKQSVKVGEFVPPPPIEIPRLMSDLEKYINDTDIDPLIKSGLVHLQFETIHPFLDGNGRIGRMLIVLMLINSNRLKNPLIYPSYYFKKHRSEYYNRLDRVRTHGDFEGWIIFYLKSISESAKDANKRILNIIAYVGWCNSIMSNDPKFSKMRKAALATLNFLFKSPVVSITDVSNEIGKSYNAAHNVILKFLEAGLITENKAKTPSQPYHFSRYLDLLNEEFKN